MCIRDSSYPNEVDYAHPRGNLVLMYYGEQDGVAGNGIFVLYQHMASVTAAPYTDVYKRQPTGLAAKRMTDSTHMAADTIHHACGLVPANNASGFSPAKDCTIRPGFIGIDEMSMVGTHLFGFAMDAIPNRENTLSLIHILLVGNLAANSA